MIIDFVYRQLALSLGLSLIGSLITSVAHGLTWDQPNHPDANTIALYHFDEGAGTTAANSQGNSTRDLTLTSSSMHSGAGAGWLNSPAGGFISTDETDYALNSSLAFPTDYSQGLTISVWLRSTDLQAANVNLLAMYGSASYVNENRIGWRDGFSSPIRPTSNDVAATVPGAANSLPTTLLDGQWHHLAMVFDPMSASLGDEVTRFYLDNSLIHSWDSSAPITAGTVNQLLLGRGGAEEYIGDIDELLIQAEVLSDFSAGINPQVATSSAPVPEPGSWLLLVGMLLQSGRRLRRPS